MSRAEELKQCFKTKSHSNPDELLNRYSKENPELRKALQLANIAEMRVINCCYCYNVHVLDGVLFEEEERL